MAGSEAEARPTLYSLLYVSPPPSPVHARWGPHLFNFQWCRADTVIFTGFVVVYYFHGMFYLGLFMLYSIWIPQIFCNATQVLTPTPR
jgi:hypothetical protein